MKKILIIWEGLNSCSLLINELVESKNYLVDLIYTKANVPFKDQEKLIPGINFSKSINSLDDLNKLKEIKDYDLVISTGWKSKNINKLLKLRKKNNSKLLNAIAVDNKIASDIFLNIEGKFNYTLLRQIIGAIYYRLILRKYIDFCFVPGNSSNNLMRFLGHKSHKIFFGYYGAYEKIYTKQIDYLLKKNRFIFVGQLIKRKGIELLINAYNLYYKKGGDWDLIIIGGNLKTFEEISSSNRIIPKKIKYFSFMQPEDISKEMHKSKAFILPSIQDNWGTVLCEAANAGCFLLSSEQSGASGDLVKNGINGFTFNSKSKNSVKILEDLMTKTEKLATSPDFKKRLETSKSIASSFNSMSYKLAVESMLI